MNTATVAALAASATLVISSCQSGRSKCEQLGSGRDFAATHQACALAYDKTGDPELGALAAVGAFYSGQAEAGERLLEQLGDSPAAGIAWRAAGDLRTSQGDRARAANAFKTALRLHEAAADHAGSARVLLSLSSLAWVAADYDAAGGLAARAEASARRADSQKLLVSAAKQHAAIYYDVGAYDAMRTALDSLRSAVGPDHPNLLVSEGLIHLDEGRASLARARFAQALEAMDPDDATSRRAALLNLVQADIQRGKPDRGLTHLQAAEQLATTDNQKTAVAVLRARLTNALGQPEQALSAARGALAADVARDWRWELELEAGRAALALGDSAGGEAHLLAAIDVLEDIRAGNDRADYKQALLARKRAPFDALVELYVAADKPEPALAIAEKARTRTLVEAIVQSSTAPVEQATTRATEAALDRGRAALGEATAVIYYRTRSHYHRIVATRDAVSASRLPTGAGDIDRMARALRANPNDRDIATRLGAALEPPAARVLYLVVDGALADAPLSAVRVDGQYLVQRSDLAIAPSLGVLGSLATADNAATTAPAVVLGDPLGDLPAANDEARLVAERLGATAHVETAATLEAATAARPRVLHFAAHADRVGLRLADHTLTARDIIERGIAADLVVLATCRGAERREGGLLGSLAGSFLIAGSRAVVATTRSVDDADSRQLVLAMYSTGDPSGAPASALGAAQRQLAAQNVPPSRWSTIATIGLAHPNAKDPTP